jgi:preprotein translocase subunit SecF
MEFFSHNTTINFMALRKRALVFSACIFLCSIIAIASHGLKLGLDFTGGTQIEVHFETQVQPQQLRNALQKADFPQATVQSYGTSYDAMIRVAPHEHLDQQAIKTKIQKIFANAEITRVEFIGPQVGKALFINGMLAIFVSLIATMLYIALRFEYRFAISAAVSLIHDPILILGIFAWFNLEFNLITLAALLTILGYSLNDTIVVYDRARENFLKRRTTNAETIMNLSINQTLSRTIMTSGLTFLVVLSLYVFGGESLQGFSLALMIGIIIGTYSSIYIAGSLAVHLGLSAESFLPKKRIIDDRP